MPGYCRAIIILSFTLEVDSTTELSQTYTYDVMNRLYQVYENNTLTATYAYDTMGNRSSLTYANGVVEGYAYNLANLVTSVTNTYGQTTLSSFAYAYNLSGNQTSKTDHNGRMTAYTYDDNGRLLTETETLNGTTTFSATYTYDLRGNRTGLAVTGSEEYTVDYDYDLNNRLLQEDKTVGTTTTRTVYGYDDNGNMTGTVVGTLVDGIIPPGTGVETAYTYDVFNRLTAVGEDITYTYRPDGLRLTKTVDTVTTTHIWDGSNIVAETDGTNVIAVYIRGINLIAVNDGTNTLYYLYNAHGDVVQQTNTSGTVTKTYDYDAFGNERNISPTDTNPFRYCGEYFDKETGKLYLRSRYYDSVTGRFTQEDSFSGYANDPLSLNQYTYCHNNPIRYTDPWGHAVTPWDVEYCSDEDIGNLIMLTAQWNVATTQKERDSIHSQAEAIRNKYRTVDEYGTGDGNTVSNRIDESIVGAALAMGITSGLADGPLPFGDAIGIGIIIGGIILGDILDYFHAKAMAEKLSWADAIIQAVTGIKIKRPNDTVIFRYGGTNPGNFVPSKNDVAKNSGLSFSTIPLPGCAVTTIGLLNATGVVRAVQDGLTHVSVYPIGGTISEWRAAGKNSPWTVAVKSVIIMKLG